MGSLRGGTILLVLGMHLRAYRVEVSGHAWEYPRSTRSGIRGALLFCLGDPYRGPES